MDSKASLDFSWKVFHPMEHIAAAVIDEYARPKGWDAFEISIEGESYRFAKINGTWPKFEKAPAWSVAKKKEFMSQYRYGTLTAFVGDLSKTRDLTIRHRWMIPAMEVVEASGNLYNEVYKGKKYVHKESLDGASGIESLTVGSMAMGTSLAPFLTYKGMPISEKEVIINGGYVNCGAHVFDAKMKDGSILPIYEVASLEDFATDVENLKTDVSNYVQEVSMKYDEASALRIVLEDKDNNLSCEFLAGIDTYGPGNTMMKEVFIYQLYMLSLYLVQLQTENKLSAETLKQFMVGNTFKVPVRSSGGWCYPLSQFQVFYEDVVANTPTTKRTLYKLSGSDILLKTAEGYGIVTGSSINSSCFVWALCYYFARYLNGSTPLAISIAQTFASSDMKIWKLSGGCVIGNTSEVFNSGKPIIINDTSSPINRLNVAPLQDTLTSMRTGLEILGYSYDKPGKKDNGNVEHYILVEKTADKKLIVIYDSNRSFGDPNANDIRFAVGKDVTYLLDYVEDKGILVYYKGSMLSQLFAKAEDASQVVLS